jgi:hypothetical protein
MNEVKYFFMFFGAILLSFATGVILAQQISNLSNGFWFLGIGFLFLMISLFMPTTICELP